MTGVGSLMQLAAVGLQNSYLDLDSEVTAWQQAWKRPTPFALQTMDALFPTGVAFGQTSIMIIPKSGGDLLTEAMLQVVLPATPALSGRYWVDTIGYALLASVKLFLGDTLVSSCDKWWYDVYDHLYLTSSRQQAVARMVGRGVNLPCDVPHELYVPLRLFFSASTSSNPARPRALPLLAMTGTQVRLQLEVEPLAAMVAGGADVTGAVPLDARLLLTYVFLDAPERQQVLCTSTEVLVHESRGFAFDNNVVDNTMEQVVKTSVSLPLGFMNHAVKQIIWLLQPDAPSNPDNPFFTYLDAVQQGTLYMQNVERFTPRDGAYFRLVNPHDYCAAVPTVPIYSYSFALDAGQWQPSGAVDMSAQSGVYLRLLLSTQQPATVRVYSWGYNVLVIRDGMATLRFQ